MAFTKNLKPCGTYAAYRRHLRNNERPCEPCKRAMVAYSKGEECVVPGCDRPQKARDWCSAHYWRWLQHGDIQADQPIGHVRRRPKASKSEPAWNLGDRIVDLLAIDGEWWTPYALAARFDAHVDSIKRQLRRLEEEGSVRRRIVDLAAIGDRQGIDRRTEWTVAE